MTKDERIQWRITRRTENPPYDLAWEVELHARYTALRALGWREVVWCEAGAYYLPNTPHKPDFNDKRRITLDDFETILTSTELLYAKKPSESARKIATPLPSVQRA